MKIRDNYAAIVSTLALVVALTTSGAYAASQLTGGQIKNGTITAADLDKNAVHSRDIAPNAIKGSDVHRNAIQSSDIGAGQVTAEDVTLPAPAQLKNSATAVIDSPTTDFQRIYVGGTYDKQDASSALEIDWTGSVFGENAGEASGCIFQLRVDGQPAAGGGGEAFGTRLIAVSASAVFSGLAAGPHQIEIWARVILPGQLDEGNECVVGPEEAGIAQTFVVTELVT